MENDSTSTYGDLIKEAFIDPIRSVLIIDDEYPTIEQVLECQIENSDLKDYENPTQILSAIKGLREGKPALIVDTHDGSEDIESGLEKYLHQSDLLVLDYELDSDDGKKSIEITKKVFSNDHFNMIVVHTSSTPIKPFEKNLIALLAKCEKSENCQNKINEGTRLIEVAEDEDPRVVDKIQATVGFQQYVTFRQDYRKCLKAIRSGEPPFSDFHELINDRSWKQREPNDILYWALSDYEIRNAGSFGDGVASAANWSLDFSGPLWIRTNKGFITFIQKKNEIKLLDELQTSLESWKPTPSRLLSAKLRAKIDDQGVIAEDHVLAKRHVHAKFYDDLYSEPNGNSRRAKIDSQIDRKIEDITSLVKIEVADYLEKIVSIDLAAGGESLYQSHYGVDLKDKGQNTEGVNKFNAYVSCYPTINGWHLAPGHILEINDHKWICLSPVCDLVPSQKKSGIYGDVGDGKPFFAVKLHKKKRALDPSAINSNNFIFIPDRNNDGEVEQYGFYEQKGTDPDKAVSPHWNLFVASGGGEFDHLHTLSVSRISYVTSEVDNEEANMKVTKLSCQIVAQLRYEYALNLMQKFGSEFTRIGLGYISG